MDPIQGELMNARRNLLALLSAAGMAFAPVPVSAHDTKCPHCKLAVVQDTKAQDYEVALKFGRKRIEYRCVLCAIAQAKTEFEGDLSIVAPSEIKGQHVTLTRKDGKWSVSPETTVFIAHKVNHRECEIGDRALTKAAAFQPWVEAHKDLLAGAKMLNLAEMIEISN
jgi:hypothetical protein